MSLQSGAVNQQRQHLGEQSESYISAEGTMLNGPAQDIQFEKSSHVLHESNTRPMMARLSPYYTNWYYLCQLYLWARQVRAA